jgi:hypothetical protein
MRKGCAASSIDPVGCFVGTRRSQRVRSGWHWCGRGSRLQLRGRLLICCVIGPSYLQVSQVVGRGFSSLFNSYASLSSALEVGGGSRFNMAKVFQRSLICALVCIADKLMAVAAVGALGWCFSMSFGRS